MSASLVGSEMCIRDSCRVVPGSAVAPQVRKCSRPFETVADCWGCARSVSYTHLTLPTICSV
eukprot:2415261-Alexandrium_andersonii.AAC.1